MTIPGPDDLMLPILRLVRDGQEHTRPELLNALAGAFQLSDDDQHEEVPSGGLTKFEVSFSWARTCLKEARVIEYLAGRRGRYRMTKRGLELLTSNPPHVDKRVLRQFPEFRHWELKSKRMRVNAR